MNSESKSLVDERYERKYHVICNVNLGDVATADYR